MTSVNPSLPLLYFEKNASTFVLQIASVELPSELAHRCLTAYASWGDLARLANVQRCWSSLMYDAAEQSLQAKWELAQALYDGTDGLAVSHKQAMKLFFELANVQEDDNHMPIAPNNNNSTNDDDDNNTERCFAPAMKKIAECYLTGNGVDSGVQTNAGLAWLEASHNWGNDVDAAHEVALMYEYGHHGVELDVVAAANWFEKAANAGHIEAMAELGLCYELGCGVEQNDEHALEWYMKAAERGHLTAKYSIGEAFEEARGVPQSDEEACLWYYKAAIEGDEDSRRALRRLEDIARIVVPGVGKILDV